MQFYTRNVRKYTTTIIHIIESVCGCMRVFACDYTYGVCSYLPIDNSMYNYRDNSKQELDRLTDSKSILENNNKSFFTSPPGLVPPFGILIHQVGNVLNPTLSYRAGGPLSPSSEGQSPEGGGGHDLQGREGPHRSGNGLCHSGKTYSKSYLTMSHLG